MKLKLLMVETDEGRINFVEKFLNREFYNIEFERSWGGAFEKIKNDENKYDIIILNPGISHVIEDANKFFRSLKSKHPQKLNVPFIISKAVEDDIDDIKKILSGKKVFVVDKDSKDISELDWAILNLEPRIFSKYKEKINTSYNAYQHSEKKVDELDKKINQSMKIIESNDGEVKNIIKEQERMEKKYVKWRDIIETLSILVGAFSLAMGIIFSAMLSFFSIDIKTHSFKVSFIFVLIVFSIVVVLSVYISYIFFKRKTIRIVEHLTNEKVERLEHELFFKETRNRNA